MPRGVGVQVPPFAFTNNNMDLKKYKLMIFDIDGTLYDQKQLRKKMILDILLYYFLRPHKLHELKILKIFREERERKKGYISEDLENDQYLWVAEKTKFSIDLIRNVINKWIFVRPLKHLLNCRYGGVESLFLYLKKRNIKIGIYSDYPTKEKMDTLKLERDMEISSTDKEINALKPDPKGLQYVLKGLEINVKESLFIGDRESTDGMCAKNTGMDYMIIDKKGKIYDQLLIMNK